MMANSKHSILALNADIHALRQHFRQDSGNTDAQVDIHTITDLLCGSCGDSISYALFIVRGKQIVPKSQFVFEH
jgi:hypothetical protein